MVDLVRKDSSITAKGEVFSGKLPFTSDISGALSTTVSMTFSVSGNICCLQVNSIPNTTSASAAAAIFDVTSIPDEFMPTQLQDFIIRGVVNGASIATQISLNLDKTLTMTSSAGGAAWTAGWTANRWSSFTLYWIKGT